MATELRDSGISIVDGVPWGTHFCTFYETKQDLLDILIPFFKAGLESQEFCLWIISNSELLTQQEAMSALQKALPDLDRHLSRGSLELVEHDQWFLEEGTFDLYVVAQRFKEKLDAALAKGYVGMRLNGSPAWLYEEDQNELITFEQEADRVFHDLRLIASCTYPITESGAGELLDVAATHQFVLTRRHGDWAVFETPELRQAKVELKKLNEELEQRVIGRTRQLRALSERLRSAREEEGTRIAREIHDQLGGALTSLRWDLEEVGDVISKPADSAQLTALRKKLKVMMSLTATTLDTVRRVASELRPTALDELGLVEAIEWQAQQFENRTGIAVQYECSLEKVGLNSEQSTAVFRILQEALTNILRHAQATKATITMEEEAGELFLAIEDNGKGITEDEKSGLRSLGLLGMRERAHLIGAQIEVIGMNGKGTLITLRVPLTESGKLMEDVQ
jgi:signal transduction histidine kinase